jgi:peptide/nickel transport system permease protein
VPRWSRLIAERLPATLELALVAALLALVIGVPLGVSLPIFLIGVLLLLVFAIERVVVCM